MRLFKRLETDGAFLFRWRSYAPLLLIPALLAALVESAQVEEVFGHFVDDLRITIAMAVSICGLAIRWVTVGFAPAGTSGRNTKAQRANTLNTTGMYSIVRNPLYVGNFLAVMGVVLSIMVWWFVVIACLAYWLYIERVIAAEESYLAVKFGDNYRSWIARTPAFFPKFSGWRRPVERFSIRTVCRREYNGLMAVAAAFFLVEFIMDIFVKREPLREWVSGDQIWLILLVCAGAVFFVLRTLKKHTAVLDVEGR